jgi:hypothetical protein
VLVLVLVLLVLVLLGGVQLTMVLVLLHHL